jgi:hypothetical protein
MLCVFVRRAKCLPTRRIPPTLATSWLQSTKLNRLQSWLLPAARGHLGRVCLHKAVGRFAQCPCKDLSSPTAWLQILGTFLFSF